MSFLFSTSSEQYATFYFRLIGAKVTNVVWYKGGRDGSIKALGDREPKKEDIREPKTEDINEIDSKV